MREKKTMACSDIHS